MINTLLRKQKNILLNFIMKFNIQCVTSLHVTSHIGGRVGSFEFVKSVTEVGRVSKKAKISVT